MSYKVLWVIHKIFPLILGDIFSINRLTLILKIIDQCDIKHIMTLSIKTIVSVFMDSTNVITALPTQTLCDTIDNVCLDLYNCHYSIFIK